MDALTEVLHDLRLSGSFYCRAELRAPWGIELPPRDVASFHFVAEGRCFLRGSDPPCRLDQGDLVVLPHGRGHVLSDSPEGPVTPIDQLTHDKLGRDALILSSGGDGERALLICGGVELQPMGTPLVELLPDVVLVRPGDAHDEEWIRATVRVMEIEVKNPRPGSETVITRLADVLVVGAIRTWLETSREGRAGWLGALRDPQIGRALALIHRRAEDSWTVESLAHEVHMSRAVFAERFAELVGAPPVHYLTRWRMHLASEWIRDENLALGEVATRLGYSSDASFSRAFKRHVGVSPGSLRRSSRR